MSASAQTITTLHTFSGTDGSTPNARLVLASDGNFYGTTYSGGPNSGGTVFRVNSSGTFATVYSFIGTDGSAPYASLIIGGDGNLYGTTYSGGASNLGTVFKLSLSGTLTPLHTFSGSDGSNPIAGLTLGSDGNFYGTASHGGAYNRGVIYKITPSGTFTGLYSFSGPDGAAPYSGLTFGSDGNLYGTTESGGSNTFYGTIFKITTGGTLTTLYNFGFTDGSGPYASLTLGSDGNFYSTTSNGGANTQYGTVFKIIPGGALTAIHAFTGADGSSPESELTLGTDGNFYGSTTSGLSSQPFGTLFQISPSGTFKSLYTFSQTDGAYPTSALTLGSDGKFYGATSGGGASAYGTIFQFVACPTCTTTAVTSSANPSSYGAAVTFTAKVTPNSGSNTPTGTVTFMDGGTTLGSSSLVSGSASFTISTLTAGPHTITANYAGDGTFQPSVGSIVQSVGQGASATTLTSSVNPSTYNQMVSLSAQVSPATATGTVTFTDNSNMLGTASVVSGVATLTTSSLSVGSHSLGAQYGGDGAFLGSSGTLTQVVNQAPSSIQLTSSANPAYPNASVTFIATVSGQNGGVPSGSLSFTQNSAPVGSPVILSAGQGSVSISFPTTGSYTIGVTYSGDPNYVASSNSLGEVIQAVPGAITLTTLHNFTGSDGSTPVGRLTLGADGNYYGTTSGGGDSSVGSIFKVTPTGALTTLYSFNGTNGSSPKAGVTLGADGNFYGTTAGGGTNNLGTVYQYTPAGVISIIHSFTGADGSAPSASLTQYSDGSFYGTTSGGGSSGNGTVFNITSTGTLNTLYNFAGTDGSAPLTGLTAGGDGNFYGSTSSGGTNSDGTLFSITPGGVLSTIHIFAGTDGSVPLGDLTLGSDGNLYGTTSTGGLNPQYGTVFRTSLTGQLTTIYNFANSDGANPKAALIVGADGKFYGSTSLGGAYPQYGTLFSITAAGALTSLHDFAGPDGANPLAALTASSDGITYYGTASTGGSGSGAIFKFEICTGCTTTSVTSSLNPSTYGSSVTFAASVAPVNGTGTPTGSVTFTDSGNSIGSATLTNGSASISTSTLSAGQHTILASYGGDGTYQASAASVLQVVNQNATSTSFTSSVNPSSFGQNINLTATVTVIGNSGTPTGMVTFKDGSNTLGTGTLASGVASFSTSTLAVGSHSLSAVYGGDTNDSSSTGTLTQVVNAAGSSTKLASSLNPSQYSQSVTLTATVTPLAGSVTPTGSVTFKDGSTTLATVNLSGGVATFSASTLTVGTHSLSAVYGGDSNYGSSTGTLSQVVNPANTATTVTSNLNPSVYDQSVTLKATVTQTAGAGTPSGNVVFTRGSQTLGTVALSGGTASLTTSSMTGGTQNVTAAYQGIATLTASSGNISQIVNQATTSVTLTAAPNPANVNQTVTFTATVSAQFGGSPTGTVKFFSNGTQIGSPVTVASGKATTTKSFSTGGTYSITASYSGDTNFTGSTSSTVSEVINGSLISTTTALKTSGSPSLVGTQVTFTATVTPASGSIPNGEKVTFYNGTATLGTGTTTSGAATFKTAGLAAGTYSITATYAGDSAYATSTSPAVQQVVNKYTTTTTLTSSKNPSTYGTSVTLTAKVTSSGPLPTGSVTFKNGSASISGATLASGTATFTTTQLPGGSDSLTAVYNGDGYNNTSTSPVLTETVNPASTTTTITSSVNPINKGQSVTFTATVTSAAGTPVGSVSFTQGSKNLGTVSLTSGKGSVSTTSLPSGSDTITATFNANSSFAGSSGTFVETVH